MNSLKGTVVITALCVLATAYGQPSDAPSECGGISRGKEFVIAFTSLQNTVGEFHIVVVAFSAPLTRVTLSSKHQVNGTDYEKTIDIPAHGFRRITIPYEFLLQPSSDRSDRVLRVTASSDVSVYGMNNEPYSTDAFLALPNIQLGSNYIVTSIKSTGGGARLAIVGLEDSTETQILLTARVNFNAKTYNKGEILSFVVNSDEAVQVVGVSGADLSGSLIRSSNPVAAYSGHQCASIAGSYCDILSEQLIPVDGWGKRHIYTATAREDDTSIFRIFAFFDATIISVPGIGNRTLNSGDFWDVQLRGNGVISSNFPSKIVQILRFISGSLGHLSTIQVPSEEQFAFVFGFTTPHKSGGDGSGFFNFVDIVVKGDECSTVAINGQLIQCTSTASPVPDTDYVVVTESLPKGEGVYFIEQSSSKATSPMSVIVYGYDDDETYGYSAGLSLPSESSLLNIRPFIVHTNGSDILTATLPCVGQKLLNQGKTRCRFREVSMELYTVIEGRFQGFYQVLCPTFSIQYTGLITIDISTDGGVTYPYSGTFYVTPQDVLPTKAIFTVENSLTANIHKERKKRSNPLEELIDHFLDSIDYQRIRREDYRFAGYLGDALRAMIQDIRNRIDPCSLALPTLRDYYTAFRYGLPPCPCNSLQASWDDRYLLSNFGIDFFHRGAQSCYRKNAYLTDAGVQCCYNAEGSLILEPENGAGSADAISPALSFKNHVKVDVAPWVACCRLSTLENACEIYNSYRPPIGCTGYYLPRSGG